MTCTCAGIYPRFYCRDNLLQYGTVPGHAYLLWTSSRGIHWNNITIILYCRTRVHAWPWRRSLIMGNLPVYILSLCHLKTTEHILSPPIPRMDFPNTWNRTPTPDQLVANQDVLDNDLHCTFVNPPGGLFCTTDMSSIAYLNTVAADHQTSSTNHPTQPTFGSWTSNNSSSNTDHNRRNLTQDTPPPQSVYPYTITANMHSFVPNHYDSWHILPTLHGAQPYNSALGGASIGHSYSPAIGSDYYSSSSTTQNIHPKDHPLRSTISISSQNTAANHDTPFVFDPTILSRQWQNPAIPHPGPPSLPSTPMVPPPLATTSSRFKFVTQPCARPLNHPDPFPLHSHPSSPLLSCRWLNDDTVTPCGFTGTLDELKAHCSASHFTGPKIECQWEDCSYSKCAVHVMRRDCIWRHIREVHLGLRRGT